MYIFIPGLIDYCDFSLDVRPKRLTVKDKAGEMDSVVYVSQNTIDELHLRVGDVVFVKGHQKKKESVCIVRLEESCPDDEIRIGLVVSYYFISDNNFRLMEYCLF